MKDWLDIILVAISVIGTLGGAYLGGYFTRKSQLDLFSKELHREKEKEYNGRIERTLELYNKVLKNDGEVLIVENLGGGTPVFNEKEYTNKIRPILYAEFHLIHQDVANTIRIIDDRIASCNFITEMSLEDHEFLTQAYFKLFNQIQSHMENYRKTFMN